MTTTAKKYEITIPGEAPHTWEGTQEDMWKHISARMVHAPAGQYPKIVPIEQAEPTATVETTAAKAPETHEQAVKQGVNPDGAARSTADLLAAKAAGFAPRRPYYDRGTPVIGLGVDNARASAREHEAKPRVGEAVAAFVEHVKAENRRDQIVPIARLGMREDGTLTGNGDGARWTVEPRALPQLAARLGVSQPGFLTEVWPHLRAQIWNQHVATAIGHEKSTCPADHPIRERLASRADSQVTCRLRDDSNGNPSLWAAVSERYTAFDVDSIAHALEIGMRSQPDARCEISYTGHSAKMDVLFHSNVQPERYVAGEFFKAGLRVRTSDAGGGSISIGLLLYQNLCLNLICIDVASFTLDRIKHIGTVDAVAERFRAAIGKGTERLDHFLRAWGYATDESLCERTASGYKPEHLRLLDSMDESTISEAELLTGVFAGLGKAGNVSIGKQDLPGLLAAHARDNSGAVQVAPVTRASIVNAITRYAHEDVGRVNPGKQAELEREAGALLVSARGSKPAALPFLPPKRRELTVNV